MPAPLHAEAQKKKHVATQHGVAHANAHPETQAKKRDGEARKRLAKDRQQEKKNRKQQKSADKTAKARETHPVAQVARRSVAVRHTRVARVSDRKAKAPANPGTAAASANTVAANAAKPDAVTADRVHAWVSSQKQAKPSTQLPSNRPSGPTDPRTATSADFVKSTSPASDTSATGDSAAGNAVVNPTGTSTPPPDKPETTASPLAAAPTRRQDMAKPVSVVSVVRSVPGIRPQLPPVEDLAAEPVILPTLYNKRGRLVVPPPMKGSHEILIRQNQVADDEGLDRIQNDEDLDRLRAAGLLIAIPSNVMLHVDERLPLNRRYCRPWTALFLDTLARQHYARFQSTLQLTSAVRTVEFQQQLIHRNGNAAPAEGDTASPHLTGQAIDIGKKGLTTAEIAWLRGYLLPLVQQGKIDVEEEFQQSCFHISVYKKYLPRAGVGRRSIAARQGDGLDVLASGLQ